MTASWSSDRTEALARAYLQAQLDADGRAALALITDRGIDAGVPVPELYVDVVQWAQREVGRLWQEGAVSVAREHIATAISQLALSRLYAVLPPGEANGRTALVACVEGERHDLGARVVADFHEMHGYGVRFLGGDVPLDQLLGELEREPADLLALSCAFEANVPSLRAAVESVRERFTGIRVAVGGHAVDLQASLRNELDVVSLGGSAHEAVLATDGLFAPP